MRPTVWYWGVVDGGDSGASDTCGIAGRWMSIHVVLQKKKETHYVVPAPKHSKSLLNHQLLRMPIRLWLEAQKGDNALDNSFQIRWVHSKKGDELNIQWRSQLRLWGTTGRSFSTRFEVKMTVVLVAEVETLHIDACMTFHKIGDQNSNWKLLEFGQVNIPRWEAKHSGRVAWSLVSPKWSEGRIGTTY